MNKELELEVEKYCEKVWGSYKDDVFKHDDIITDKTLSEISKTDFIAGVTSEYVERQKLEFAIEQLNKLDSVLQSKIEMLNRLLDDSKDSDNREYFRTKISGVRLAKEEIRRDIRELKQKLSEL